jgi:hypothetical protein
MNATPCSGWLSKLSTNTTFGTSRWQSRFFILLASELRYYKDEYSAIASRTINLRDIARVVIVDIPNHPFTFRLEPTLYFQNHRSSKKQQQKTWTIECHSEFELEAWVAAINLRLSRLVCCFQDDEQGFQIVQPATISFPFSIPETEHSSTYLLRTLTVSSLSSSSTSGSSGSSGSSIYSNEEGAIPQPRPLRRSKPSISRRRGVILSPLEMEAIPGLENDILSSSSARSSSLPSPVIEASNGRSNDTIIEEIDEEELSSETMGYANKVTTHDAYLLDASSPTFALYKERFHL